MKLKIKNTRKNKSRKNKSRKGGDLYHSKYSSSLNYNSPFVNLLFGINKKHPKCIDCKPFICLICNKEANNDTNGIKLCSSDHYIHGNCYCIKDTDTEIIKEKKKIIFAENKCPACLSYIDENFGTIVASVRCGPYE